MVVADSKSMRFVGADLSLGVGFAALAVPTIFRLAASTWTHDTGAQGPIVLATGAWLLWRQTPALRRAGTPDNTLAPLGLLVIAAIVYLAGRITDYMTIEAGGLYLAGIAVLDARFGGKALRAIWFPLLYLAFVVPPPDFILVELTAPLKQLVAYIATSGLAAAGIPVAHEGVTITVGAYRLLVEDACSGMNSLIGLTAISLLYIYLMRAASPGYSIVLTFLVIPIAIVANIIRIVALILITYYLGDAVAQSFIHFAAGLLLFALALLLVFAVDGAFYPLAKRWALI